MTVIGIENEYGISVAGVPGDAVDPVALSAAVVTAGTPLAARWDFSHESPLRDQRGGHLPRHEALPEMLTNELIADETRHANRLLPNGARFYVDHAHPEYSGPEVRSAGEAVLWDAAGDRIVLDAAAKASERLGLPVRIHKNNTDGKGASYGCHENYLVPRSVPFERIVSQFSAHLVTRSVLCGAGRVGLGQRSQQAGFQLTQRADFFEARAGLETTIRRPVINTRDEPHADPRRWRRLHVITGDALIGQVATSVKVGSAALVLQVIADGQRLLPVLTDPVRAFHQVSHDTTLSVELDCLDGIRRTALQLQREWWQACVDTCLDDPWITDAETVLSAWDDLLTDARDDPMLLADRVDWAAKLRLLEGMRRRRDLDWGAPELAALDLQWSDLDPTDGLGTRLAASGALQTIWPDQNVEWAMHAAPTTTRAWLRGQLVSRFGAQLAGVNWDHLTLVSRDGRLHGIDLSEPLADTADDWAEALVDVASVEQLVIALGRGRRR
ncbi:depupylase/deamidase Dop [Aestuariimicrobium ganziense]|uniref:depupylase/deamidase Dop n=1 Tax=Aestuariimicrobium ganziense TaxID=2773677 RepID=UPI001944F821|nr:depupylase/deamidase Dop [Aestuariimicrobium ganziense]